MILWYLCKCIASVYIIWDNECYLLHYYCNGRHGDDIRVQGLKVRIYPSMELSLGTILKNKDSLFKGKLHKIKNFNVQGDYFQIFAKSMSMTQCWKCKLNKSLF